MAITLAMTIYALVVAILLWVSGGFLGKEGLFQKFSWLSWLGLVASFGLLSTQHIHGGGALLLSASIAASCVMASVPARWWMAVQRVGVVAVILGICSVILTANAYYEPVIPDRNLILFAGQWSVLAAGISAALAAVANDRKAGALLGSGVIATALVGAVAMGNMRYALPGFKYVVELSSGDGIVRWMLPSVTPGASLFNLPVTQVVEGVQWVLLGAAVLALVAGAAYVFARKAKQSSVIYGMGGLASFVALGQILWSGFNARLPEMKPYSAFAQELGKEQGVPEQILNMGRFQLGETIYVLWLDVLGDMGLVGAAGLMAVVLAFALRKESDSTESLAGEEEHSFLREMSLYTAGLTWLAWMLSTFLNWRIHAIYGVGSATEWSMLGGALLATGGAILVWHSSSVAQRLGALAVLMAPVLIVVYALVFEVPPGVVMP